MKLLIIGLLIVGLIVAFYFIKGRRKTIDIKETNQPNALNTKGQEIPRETIEDWERNFQGVGLGHYWDFFKTLLRNEILISASDTDASEFKVGQSKIGGQPDLPNNLIWFKENNGKSLSFLAQINLAEINSFDEEGLLPKRGILYFFYSAEQEAWGFDIKDIDKFKVFYFDGDESLLNKSEFPSDLEQHSKFKACKLTYSNSMSLPNWESDLVRKKLNSQEQDIYIDISSTDGEINKLLGHSDNIQGTMEDECQLVTNGLYCGDPSGYNDPRAEELKKDSNKWRLLFQLDSVDKAGMMWGDVGRVYVWIKEEDLRNKLFEKAWFVLQCS